MPQLDIMTYMSANIWLTIIVGILIFLVGTKGIPYIYSIIIYRREKQVAQNKVANKLIKIKTSIDERNIG